MNNVVHVDRVRRCLRTASTSEPIVHPRGDIRANDIGGENGSNLRKVCPIAALSTTNSICFDPGKTPIIRGERPAINHMSHGTAIH